MSEQARTGYLLEDFRIFYNADRKMRSIPLHCHDFHKIVILLGGNVSYMIEGRSFDLMPGDLVLVRAGAMHRPVIHDSSLYERIIIYISPFFTTVLPQGPEDDGNRLIRDLFEPAHPVPELIRPDRGMAEVFRILFGQLRELAAERAGQQKTAPYGSGLLAHMKTAELMVLLMRCLRGDQMTHGGSASADSTAAAIMACIRENLSDPSLCVDTVAAGVNLNRSYLMHYFREQTGYTIGSYITEKRLFLARSRILRGEAATTVCYDCGFGSYSSFYRAYQKKYGTSPTQRGAGRNISVWANPASAGGE